MADHRPLVEALRLDNLLTRQRRLVLRLAQQLEDAELVRQVLESELHRVRHPLVVAGTPDYLGPNNGQSSPPLAGANGAAVVTTPTEGGDAHAGAPRREPRSPQVAPRADSTSAERGAIGRAHPGFKDETGNRYGELVVVRRAANANGNARWLCRCDRGHEQVVEGIRLRAQGDKTLCAECSGKAPKACSFCGEAGHTSAGCPERPGTAKHRQVRQTPKPDDCTSCSSMRSRVVGPRCVDCGLEAERPPRATDFSGGDSALARAIG